jgi:hypothetical protein
MSAAVPTTRPADDELREQAIAALKRRRKFFDDAAAYVVVNAVLWLIWALSDGKADGRLPWPAWVSIVWGFFLGLDAWRAFGGLRRPISEAEIDAEVRRLRGD